MLSGREIELWICRILETLFTNYPKIWLMRSGGIPTNQKMDYRMYSFPHSSFSGGVVTGIKCLVCSWNLLMIRPQKRLDINRLERNESGLTLRNGVLREGRKFKGWFGNQQKNVWGLEKDTPFPSGHWASCWVNSPWGVGGVWGGGSGVCGGPYLRWGW